MHTLRYSALGAGSLFALLALQACTMMDAAKAAILLFLMSLAIGGGPSCTGQEIIFLAYDGNDDEVFLVKSDGSGLTQLTHNNRDDHNPIWSCDAQWIAFDNRDVVFVMRSDGTQLRKLVTDGHNKSHPAFSKDGTMIAFETTDGIGDENIAVVNFDGTGYRLLVENNNENFDAAWSPDGSKIAFVRRNGTNRLYTINVDGTGLKELASASNLVDPVWNPVQSKNQIAFSMNNHIHTINADGSGLTQITDGPVEDDPMWNDNGTKLAYESKSSNAVHVINVNGSNQIKIAGGNIDDIHWSPLGDRLVYADNDIGVFRVNPDGTGLVNLTPVINVPQDDDFDVDWQYHGTVND
jgi:TolB protein